VYYEQSAIIDNTCCPVCGTGISPNMPTVELKPSDKRHGLLVTIHVDSQECANVVAGDPDKYIEAAEINQVAH
jgi:hypothetical protein